MRPDRFLFAAPLPEASLLVDVADSAGTGSSRLAVFGDVDHLNAVRLQQAVSHVLRDEQPRYIDMDIAGVPFLDTGGIRALLVCQADARRVGCRITLVNVQRHVHRVLEIVGLLEDFGVPAPR
jgi:anti-anti-sigma factor